MVISAGEVDPYWSTVAKGSLDDIREALLTGYKDGKPFHCHTYHLLRPNAEQCEILDFGCGIGRNFPNLKPHAKRLTGFDIPEMIEACGREGLHDDVRLFSDWSEVSASTYDLTVATLVLQHLIPGDSLAFYLEQIARISPFLYVSSRAWCDGEGNRNILREILDSGHYDYHLGLVDLETALSLEYPSDTHLEFVVKSRYCKPRTPELSDLFDPTDRSYENWLRLYDTKPADLKSFKKEIARWNDPPLVSVILPTYNSDIALLTAAIESVIQQVYPNWELCIADDASEDTALIDLLKRYEKTDPRIRIILREDHGHIARTSNAALGIATGDYIALLDHDDLLSADALYWVVRTIRAHPDAALIYSDEDKIDLHGRRSGPYFKSDWNPDLFLSHNLVTHLAVYRRDIVDQVGGFDPGFDGAQDYDLALKVTERVSTDQIRHIPRILYHWRLNQGSTAVDNRNKPYAFVAAMRAIRAHLERRGIEAVVEESPEVSGHTRVRYLISGEGPLVSIIIPTRDYLEPLKSCIDSITHKTQYKHYEILIVNNDSKEEATLRFFRDVDDPRIRVFDSPGAFNFSKLMNFGVSKTRGDIVLLLNNDTEVINGDWLDEMVSQLQRPEVGVVGARLWFPDDTLQHAGVILGMGMVAGHHSIGQSRSEVGYCGRSNLQQNFTAVTGACLAIEKQTYLAVGGMNEKDLKVAFNDVDLCLRVGAKGLRIVWTPYAELYHHQSLSRGYDDAGEKKVRSEREADYMRRRWSDMVENDPAYNPNLCVQTAEMRLAFPPRGQR